MSARTAKGSTSCAQRIAEHARALHPAQSSGDLFRLPVDRAFSVAGVGTVVTGTAWSGRIGVGDEVVLLPSAAGAGCGRSRARPRGRSAASLDGRTAVGIAGHRRVRRWHAAGCWSPPAIRGMATRALDVEIALDSAAPARAGTAHPGPRSSRHGGDRSAGCSRGAADRAREGAGLARLALEAAGGGARRETDSCIRSFSPVATIGGGVVLDPIPPRPARRVAGTTGLRRAGGAAAPRWSSGEPAGVTATTALPLLTGAAAGRAPASAGASQRRSARWKVSGSRCRAARGPGGHARSNCSGATTGSIRPIAGCHWRRCAARFARPEPAVEAVLSDLVADGTDSRGVDGIVALAGFAPRVIGGDAAVDEIVLLVEAGGLTPPSVAELERQTGRRDVAAILRLAAAAGRVEPVERERYFARGALDRFVQALRAGGPEAAVVPSELRAAAGNHSKVLDTRCSNGLMPKGLRCGMARSGGCGVATRA